MNILNSIISSSPWPWDSRKGGTSPTHHVAEPCTIGWFLALVQLQRTGLGVRVHPGCFYWVWGHGTRRDSGGWHLWMQLCVGWKLVKSEGSPQWLCWLMISSVAKAVWVLCRTVPGIVVIPTAQLIPVYPALLVSCCFYVSALLVSWWDEAEVSPLCIAPNGWHWSLTPLSLSRWKDLFLAGKFPLGTERCQPGEWNFAGKVKLFFLFCVFILRFCVPLCFWSFLSGLLCSHRALFVHG